MQHIVQMLRSLPRDFDVCSDEPSALAVLSDSDLVRGVALAIAQPKLTRTSSFILHAPLELFARAALLPLAPPRQRSAGRLRIAKIAAEYAEGDELPPPFVDFPSVDYAMGALLEALREGDPETADVALGSLTGKVAPEVICAALADPVASSLAGAAHTPLLLAALPVASAQYGDLSILLRTAVRTLASESALRLSWVDERLKTEGPDDLWNALEHPPHVDVPTDFVAPTMLAVEANGFAARLLNRATQQPGPGTTHTLMRIAARSMIQDDPKYAPYGWTHCLTLPQGVLSLERYSKQLNRLTRIAATFVLGFRATLGSAQLDRNWRVVGALPHVPTLAGYAVAHADAHLAKYTVACLKAASDDVEARGLFLAAAKYLADWWRDHPIAE
jgi:hypothetical protein